MRPPLPILWPERYDECNQDDFVSWKSVFGFGLPDNWQDIIHEAKAYGIKNRKEVDPATPNGFLSLPSVQAYFGLMKQHLERDSSQMQELLAKVPAGNFIGTEFYAQFSLLRWKHHGRRVYVLDEETFSIMSQMEPPPMPSDMMKMPVGSFYLVFPPAMRFNIGIEQIQPVEGVLATWCAGTPAELMIMVAGKSNKSYWDDNLVYCTFRMDHTRTLNEVRVTRQEHFTPPPTLVAGNGGVAMEFQALSEGEKEVTETIPRIVINFCLYMMTQHPYIEPVPPDPAVVSLNRVRDKKKKRLERRMHKKSRLGYIWVGPRPRRDRDGAGTGTKLDRPAYVRAHWRWQACGPKWSERKLLLVKEHVRGAVFEDRPEIRAGRVQKAKITEDPHARRNDFESRAARILGTEEETGAERSIADAT